MVEEVVVDGSCKRSKGNCWSHLPFLLLWMVKDRLDFIDNVQLAAVCRDWYFASEHYAKKRLRSAPGDRLPWIMQLSTEHLTPKSSLREFICVSRKKKFTIDLPEFYGAEILFSKQGWLLVHRRNYFSSSSAAGAGNSSSLPDSVFLLDPFTKAKVEMPDLEKAVFSLTGSFSTTVEGYPHCVVLREGVGPLNAGEFVLTLWVAHVGDNMWSKHSSFIAGVSEDDLNCLLVIGELVYCFDLRAPMMVYNMETRVWKTPCGQAKPANAHCSMMELNEGEIIRVDKRGGGRSNPSYALTMNRYNATASAWEELNHSIDAKIKDVSCWFLQHMRYYAHFSVKRVAKEEDDHFKTKKAYILDRVRSGAGYGLMRLEVTVHDLLDGSSQMLLLPVTFNKSAIWVDVG